MRDSRWERFNGLLPMVAEAAAVIQSLSDTECRDAGFLERYLIPFLGLNDEGLAEQPPEFSAAFGKGLHIWQYPNQLAAYLVWLADHAASITSYMEIGCRWGGMFVLISEWLRKQNASLRSVTAVDLLESTPLVEAYFALLRNQAAQGQLSIEATYLCASSRSPEVRAAVERLRPGLVFIDGDHTLRGALSDHLLVRPYAQIIAHHDVCSQACADTTFLWAALKELEAHDFEFVEFVDQYSSVDGNFLGIGAMKRKDPL
jgi:hypothetical protein